LSFKNVFLSHLELPHVIIIKVDDSSILS
jgi:hypothetical protein